MAVASPPRGGMLNLLSNLIEPCSGTQALGFKTDSEKIATFRKIHAVQIYDRIYGSKAIDSDPLNSFSLYSLIYNATVNLIHRFTLVYIYIYICLKEAGGNLNA